jgi:hypothetical protein
MKKIKEVLSFVAIFVLGLSGIAFAVPCSQGGVYGMINCQDGMDNNDKVSMPLTVNTENFFGFDDWQYLQKYDIDDGLETILDYGWTVTGSGQTGIWTFDSSVWADFSDVMIVVKNGRNSPTNVYFSGYLLGLVNDIMPVTGSWDTGDKDLSHLTLYARATGNGDNGTPPVPEPGTILLLGTGLVGLVLLRRKSREA